MWSFIYQVCGKLGHTTLNLYHHFDHYIKNSLEAHQAIAIFGELVSDPSWFVNSGATNYVTSKLGNL